MRFAAALFDLDDTLHDDTRAYHAAARAAAAEAQHESGIPAGDLYAAYVAGANAFWKGLSTADLRVAIGDTRVDLWERALAACGVADREHARRLGDAYNRHRAQALELWPGVRELLVALRAAGLRIGIVTNGFAQTHREKLDRLGLNAFVDAAFMADEVGAVKPDPRFFTHAARALDVEPARCAVVGDRYDRDVIGAHAAGMYAIWLDVRGDTLPAHGRPPDAIVRDIVEVRPLLLVDGERCATGGTIPP